VIFFDGGRHKNDMNLDWVSGNGKLSINAAALAAGVACLSPLFPFIWFVAPLVGESRITLFAVLFFECAVTVGMVKLRRRLKARVYQRRHEEYISSALRRVPI
jgi:hypothetical protein